MHPKFLSFRDIGARMWLSICFKILLLSWVWAQLLKVSCKWSFKPKLVARDFRWDMSYANLTSYDWSQISGNISTRESSAYGVFIFLWYLTIFKSKFFKYLCGVSTFSYWIIRFFWLNLIFCFKQFGIYQFG